jgi:hypothetical protein
MIADSKDSNIKAKYWAWVQIMEFRFEIAGSWLGKIGNITNYTK